MSHVLMICHDQHLDRRVVAQAASLIGKGHKVTLIALAVDSTSEERVTPESIHLYRIGLDSIVPENPCFAAYTSRQQGINQLLNTCCNHAGYARRLWNAGFRLVSRGNWYGYRLQLLACYRNLRLADPLPFRSAFVRAGSRFKADLVQVHDLPGLEAGAQLAKSWQVPLVYDAHELYPEQRTFSRVQTRLCSEAEAKYINEASLVFAVNDSIAEEMARRYGIAKPIPLWNAIDPGQNFDPQAGHNLLRQKLQLSPQRRILLFQGGFAPYRNLENLILAMSRVRSSDVDLVLMGFGDHGEQLRTLARRRGLLEKRVHLLPAVPQSELLEHSASADLGVIPYPHVDLNSYYCTPNKLFEFIQSGLPILANESPELIRFVDKEGFGLVRPLHTPGQIAEAIDHAFESGAFGQWRRNLLDKRDAFTWAQQERVYLNAILPLLPSKSAWPVSEQNWIQEVS